MISTKTLYSLDDVMIQPASVTTIRHRKDIRSVYEDGYLPIFTAPMPCVVNSSQYLAYTKARINPIIPRTEKLEKRVAFMEQMDMFVAFSLDEFTSLFLMNLYDINKVGRPIKVLIDIACGSMEALHKAIKGAKAIYKDNMIIMSGNVANPEAFYKLALAGCNYIRCSVGSGSGCCTATYTGVYYPMASLIDECNQIKRQFYGYNIKLIADGGITRYRDAFKALALGADYVMMGKCFAECEESIGKVYYTTFNGNTVPCKLYYGQSSEQGQIDRFGKVKSNPEGTIKHIPVTTNLSEFCGKFEAALRSAMSYCNATTLQEFIGKVQWEPMSQAEFSAFIK